MSKTRVEWLDYAKALAILCVLVLHAPFSPELNRFITHFVMPLFYLTAGMFLNPVKPWSEFVTRTFKRLGVPYVVFSFVSYGLWLVFRHYSDTEAERNAMAGLFSIFRGHGGELMAHNIALWFLPSLFTTLCWTFLLLKLPENRQWPGLAASVILGIILNATMPGSLPWFVDLMPLTAAFAFIGHRFRENIATLRPLEVWKLLLLLLVNLAATALNPQCSHWIGEVGNPILYYIMAFSGILLVFNVAQRLPRLPALAHIGKNTLPVFGLHCIAYHFLNIFIFNMGSPVEFLPPFDGHGPLHKGYVLARGLCYVVFGLGFPLVLHAIYRELKAPNETEKKPVRAPKIPPQSIRTKQTGNV